MTAKLLLTGVTTMAMLVVVCQVGPANWGPPATDVLAGSRSSSATEAQADRVVAEGRLATYPGAEVVVATELAGTVVRLPVREKSTVHKGDLIAELGSDELRASRDEAVARIEEAEAEARFYEREVERRRVLIARRSASDVELDTNLRGLDVSRARRRAAIAARDRFDALIAKTRITSPIDGAVIARFADPGETLGIAAPLVTIADLGRVRVEAEVDEVDIGGIAPRPAPRTIVSAASRASPAGPGADGSRRSPTSWSAAPAPPRRHQPPGRHPRPPGQDRPARSHSLEARPKGRGADRQATHPMSPGPRAPGCVQGRVLIPPPARLVAIAGRAGTAAAAAGVVRLMRSVCHRPGPQLASTRPRLPVSNPRQRGRVGGCVPRRACRLLRAGGAPQRLDPDASVVRHRLGHSLGEYQRDLGRFLPGRPCHRRPPTASGSPTRCPAFGRADAKAVAVAENHRPRLEDTRRGRFYRHERDCFFPWSCAGTAHGTRATPNACPHIRFPPSKSRSAVDSGRTAGEGRITTCARQACIEAILEIHASSRPSPSDAARYDGEAESRRVQK